VLKASIVIVTLCSFGVAAAQELVPIGEIVGNVDGAPFELISVEGKVEGVTVSNVYWNDSFAGIDVTIIGQSRPALFSFTPGAMLIDFRLPMSLGSCPCPGEDPSFFYSPAGGFTSNVYDDLEGAVVVEVVEELEPGVYRMVGTFTATLGLKVGIADPPDPEQAVTISGTFTIERLAEEEDIP
jgi:hypothetical protein